MLFSNQKMKACLIAIATLLSMNASAQIEQEVVMRGNHFKPISVKVTLEDLVSSTHFDGKYFKIVKGKSNEPISLTETDEKLRAKAANVYYHLNKARNFWINEINSKNVANLPKMTIRLELTNKFSDLGHFFHDSIEPQYNNALSIPAGEPMEGAKDANGQALASWGPEIWFRPVKTIRTQDLPGSGLGPEGNPLTKYLDLVSGPIKSTAISRFIQTTLQSLFYPSLLTTTYANSVLRQVGTVALMTAILEGSKHTDKLFVEKYYYLDTAMIPEIIYHEFSHIALSDTLFISHSTPVNEGMADYFATTMSDNAHIASKIKKYSKAMPKNGYNKNIYSPIHETEVFANSDFVLAVLWSVRKALPGVADELVFNARNYLSTESSDIQHDLISSLLKSCETVCRNPRADRMKLREVFSDRGF